MPDEILDDSLPVDDDFDGDVGQFDDEGAEAEPAENQELLSELQALSDETGYDFSKFKDLESARAAHGLLVDQFYRAGFAPQAQPQQRQSTDILPSDFGDDDSDDPEDFEEEDLDAPPKKPTEKPKRKTKRERQLEKLLARERAERQKITDAQNREQLRQLADRAEAVIDSYDHAEFGKRGARNGIQNQNAVSAFYEACDLVSRAARLGQNLTIEQAQKTVLRRRGIAPTTKKAVAKEAVPPDPKQTGASFSGRAVTVAAPALDPFGLTADEGFQRGARALAAKMRGRR